MFPISDPYIMLTLQQQHVDQLRREAEAHRLAKATPRRRGGRSPRASARPRPAHTVATP